MKYLLFFAIIDLMFSFLWSGYILKKTDDFVKLDRYQALVILMGDFNDDYTALGPETLRRLNHAVSLSSDNTIDNYLCVGGSRPRENVQGARLMKKHLLDKGIPADRVYADGHSFDTKGNWADALRLIEQKDWKTIGVVSSAFHLYRAGNYLIGAHGDIETAMIPYPYNKSTPETTLADLWLSVHYEWITYTLYSLPEPLYNTVVALIRPQQAVSG